MGLLNLLTDPKNFKFYNGGQGYTGNGTTPNLKNIPYGRDRLNGGSSNQPYIQTPIPDGTSTLSILNNDFIWRGGIGAPLNSAQDVERLTKMFADTKTPSGLLFITKQEALSRSAVRTQVSPNGINGGVYSPLNTLAQAGIIAFGGHFNKQGVNPFDETGAYSNNKNLYGVKVTPTQDYLDNRLYGLYNEKILNNKFSTPGLKGFATNPIKNNPLLISYSGGPGPALGIGKTNIRFADQRTGINNPLATTNPIYFYGNSTGSISIDSDNKRVGGLVIDVYKPWILSTDYNVYNVNTKGSGKAELTTFTSIILPDFDINVAQKYGTSLQNNTSQPQHIGSASKKYNPTNTVRTVSSRYLSYLKSIDDSKTNLFPEDFYNTEGDKIYADNVYTTNIEVSKDGNIKYTYLQPTKSKAIINAQGTYVYDQKDIASTPSSYKTYGFSPKIQDFREVLRTKTTHPGGVTAISQSIQSGQLTEAPDYAKYNLEKRVNIGGPDGSGPGARANKSYANYTKGVIYPGGQNGITGPLDKINALPIYYSENIDSSKPINDLVKFRIAVINNETPTLKDFIHFRAFLDSISDSYSATWDPVRYLGRGENFYTYNGYTRQISLSWTVAAQSKQELAPMYRKLNFLASTLTPDYQGYGYMKGNLVQLTIGGYLYEQPGFITGLTYTMDEDVPWEIGLSAEGGDDISVKELTHIIRVTGFNFTPIQRFRPERQWDEFDYKHYISLADGTSVDNNLYRSVVPTGSNSDILIEDPDPSLKLTPPEKIYKVPPRYPVPDDRYSAPYGSVDPETVNDYRSSGD